MAACFFKCTLTLRLCALTTTPFVDIFFFVENSRRGQNDFSQLLYYFKGLLDLLPFYHKLDVNSKFILVDSDMTGERGRRPRPRRSCG